MNGPILSIQHLTKHYGPIVAVDDFSLDITKGSVYGILGPNGSGKTTILGTVLGVINPTQGAYTWFGRAPGKEDRKRIGAILEVPVFYPYLTALQNLNLIGRFKGFSQDESEKALEIVGLSDRKKSQYKTFSLGMKQRLAIGATLMGNPDVLILDEPTNGLDPLGIAEIRKLILEVAGRGITILLASHILDEVQKTCTHVAVLQRGKKLYSGNVEEILSDAGYVELAAANMKKLETALTSTPFVESFREENGKFIVSLTEPVKLEEINRYYYEKGIILSLLGSKKRSLENYFIDLLKTS